MMRKIAISHNDDNSRYYYDIAFDDISEEEEAELAEEGAFIHEVSEDTLAQMDQVKAQYAQLQSNLHVNFLIARDKARTKKIHAMNAAQFAKTNRLAPPKSDALPITVEDVDRLMEEANAAL